MKNIKNEGITLIALVVSIIVLLILAGIAISMLAGDNGVLNKAADAKKNTEYAQEEETVKLFLQGYRINKYINNQKDIIQELSKELSIAEDEIKNIEETKQILFK